MSIKDSSLATVKLSNLFVWRLRVDDYEDEKLEIQNENEELPLMTSSYQSFIGGIPQDIPMPNGATASVKPFIGCVRDVLVDKEVCFIYVL